MVLVKPPSSKPSSEKSNPSQEKSSKIRVSLSAPIHKCSPISTMNQPSWTSSQKVTINIRKYVPCSAVSSFKMRNGIRQSVLSQDENVPKSPSRKCSSLAPMSSSWMNQRTTSTFIQKKRYRPCSKTSMVSVSSSPTTVISWQKPLPPFGLYKTDNYVCSTTQKQRGNRLEDR